MPGERQRVAGVAGRAEPDLDRAQDGLRPGPAGHETLDQPGGGQDVDEDVLAAAGDREIPVVMNLGKVTGRQRRSDHERGVHVDLERRQIELRQLERRQLERRQLERRQLVRSRG